MSNEMPKDRIVNLRTIMVAIGLFLFALAISYKLISLYFNGDKYEQLIAQYTIKEFVIEANRGDLYSDDGSLLATSITRYDIHFDALSPSGKNFNEHLPALCDSLGKFFNRPASYYKKALTEARKQKNKYFLITKGIGYDECARIRKFPLFSLGAYKGGIVVEGKTSREYPLGAIAHRIVGYERTDGQGNVFKVGLEGAFSKYLSGVEGRHLKQKIAQGQWKPIDDSNEIEPKDGYDVVSTININIQDIAHHALLKQLETYQADHGCTVVMEVATGEIKAISNLGRTKDGTYAERFNYAVGETYEPGSVFKTVSLVTALEEAKIDTTYTVDTKKGVISFYGRQVWDSNRKGYGVINLSKAMQLSSNTAIVQMVHDLFGKNPKKFVDKINKMHLNRKLGLSISGEGEPFVPQPHQRGWSGIALEWMAFGYGVEMTPLQVLTFYNAIANNGVMLKPRMIREVKHWNKSIQKFDIEVLNSTLCSEQTATVVKKVLENTVKYGTGKSLYTPHFSMAGKTGTAQKDYKDKSKLGYISSFAGFFPADNPKYSCIVVIHNPDKKIGYYGADVSGPVFKSIAQKIYTSSLLIDTIEDIDSSTVEVEKKYAKYDQILDKYKTIVPNVIGMDAMDAIAIMENLGLTVKISGSAPKVSAQSITGGEYIGGRKTIKLDFN
ncbi:penicillin-binding protein, transpeptidase domain protein [Capnocytophaga sp. oral taxon 863 str. F0517]|nr:penicillin-binding protein, transpeptidase domain protein [Capnocytophaga sp. oral taxon 863 str. F0517]